MRRSPTNGLPDRGSRRPVPILNEIDAGPLAEQLSTHDDLDLTNPEVLALLIGHLVDRLPEPHRSAVQMTQLKGLTYQEAADLLAPELGREVHRRTVWRWAAYGRRQLREWMEQAPWINALLSDRIPLDNNVIPLSSASTVDLHDALNAQEVEGESDPR